MKSESANQHTSRVGVAPENDSSLLVRRIAQNLVQLHSKTVEVADVQRPEIRMEGIVQKGLVDCEVYRWMDLWTGSHRAGLRLG